MNQAFTQSVNGLNTTTIFTAPADGTYYVNGQLQVPSPSKGTGDSAVVAVVKKNSSTKLTSVAGATGFQTTFACAAGDVVSVVLSSSNSADQGSNVVTGVVVAGNAF